MNVTTDRPANNLRVARCTSGHGYFAWPGSVDIGCLVCGSVLATTTRQQRQQPWQILDRAEAEQGSRLDGGIPHQIRWERAKVDRHLNDVAESLLNEESEVEVLSEEGRWSSWKAGDRVARNNRSSHNLDAALREADRLLAKIARLERKLAKLGGPKEVAAR